MCQETARALGNTRISLESSIGWTQVVANAGLALVSAIGEKDRVTLLDQIVCGSRGKRLNRKSGIR